MYIQNIAAKDRTNVILSYVKSIKCTYCTQNWSKKQVLHLIDLVILNANLMQYIVQTVKPLHCHSFIS